MNLFVSQEIDVIKLAYRMIHVKFLRKGNMQKCVPVSQRISDISHDPSVFMHSVSRARKHTQAREKNILVGDTHVVTPRAKGFSYLLG